MRPVRLLLSVCFAFLTVFLTFYSLLHSHSPNKAATSSPQTQRTGLRALFSFHAPSALFPPSAIISLTDDNSTFFLSRPADFGPPLPSDGLSGQLWIGSGFGEDSLSKGGLGSQAEGELGCSDIPGWSEGQRQYSADAAGDAHGAPQDPAAKDPDSGPKNSIRAEEKASTGTTRQRSGPAPKEEDGTDDFLHFPLKGVPLYKGRSAGRKQQASKDDDKLEHADIQALQESAEIAGRVVLLSRGGCGFLEKTKWVQRRGGVALIVGDHTRGGGLITMYAHGDTSNITIPSLFTSRTTAHLLSSLVPAGKDESTDESAKTNGKPSGTSQDKLNAGSKVKPEQNRPTFTPVSVTSKTGNSASNMRGSSSQTRNGEASVKKIGWLGKFLSIIGLARDDHSASGESSRPPSSGDWVVSEDWDDEPATAPKVVAHDSSAKLKDKSRGRIAPGKAGSRPPNDDFVIGVQDWRDPDMIEPATTLATKTTTTRTQTANSNSVATATTGAGGDGQSNNKLLSGGSRAPGSGVYNRIEFDGASPAHDSASTSRGKGSKAHSFDDDNSWLNRLFRSGDPDKVASAEEIKAASLYKEKVAPHFVKEKDFEGFLDLPAEHEGLWVTMTPASMSTTPFFDTLLVLVVSPLVTLTVVYALLLLRSRIRRRRWRAPKSVVEQLPVRTYHTMSCSSSSTSSQTPSPNASSPASPLLNSDSRAGLTRTRPRSRTTSTLTEQASTSLDKATTRVSFKQHEMPRPPKKYNGKQIECVVCLEEYVDGQSRVMSLPCGHEFHAECM